jgi:uncharacterized protein YndB with AHSA1/START domain
MAAIEVGQFLAQPPDRVWHALTDPDLLARWLMPNDFRPAVGRQRMTMGILGGGWRGHLVKRLRQLLDSAPP